MGRKIRVVQTAFPIHICARTNNREPFPTSLDRTWRIMGDYLYLLSTGFNFRINSFVLMPNHFHLIATDPTGSLSDAMNYFMREVTREINSSSKRINRLWGGPFQSSVIGNPLYYLHAYKYVYRNPVAAGLVKSCEHYRFSSLPALLGDERIEFPVVHDEILFDDPEATLSWLQVSYSEDEAENLKSAFRKKKFEIPVDRKSRKPSPLTNWNSVPRVLATDSRLEMSLRLDS